MNISIVIPNYNGETILKKNLPKVLEAVKNYKKGTVEIIIPDDPSTDNSENIIQDFIAHLPQKNITGKTVTNKNQSLSGFSKNVNRGISLASGEILILLNTDVAPHNDFLEPLLAHFSDPTVFAVGCLDESIENEKIVLRGRGVGKWNRGFLVHRRGELDSIETLWASGGSSAFRKSTWDQLGGLNELYNPYYWEDIDISYRARKAGFRVLFEKKSKVIHEHGKGAIQTLKKPFHIRKTAYRNQFFFVWLNITDFPFILSHLFWLPYHVITALFRKDNAFFFGFSEALVSLPKVMVERKKCKKLFIKSDMQVLLEVGD